MKVFEEIAVWERVNATVAVRFSGFRDLATNQVWIAFGNLLADDDEDTRELGANDLICAEANLKSFLKELPDDPDQWKPTVSEAVAFFIANNPYD